MKKLIGLFVLAAMISVAGCSSGRAVVGERPAGHVVVVPPSPGAGYIWRGNAWRWGGGRYYRPAPIVIAPFGYSHGYRSRGYSRWNRY